MLPFMDEEDLDVLVNKIIEGKEDLKASSILPFLQENQIEKLADYYIKTGSSISPFLPFLENEQIVKYLDYAIANPDSLIKVSSFLPFLEEEGLQKLCEASIKDESIIKINQLLPFLENNEIKRIYEAVLENPEKYDVNKKVFYPYLEEDTLYERFMKLIKENRVDLEMVNYLSEKTLDEIVDAYLRGEMEINIDNLYPYLSKQAIKKIFAFALDKTS